MTTIIIIVILAILAITYIVCYNNLVKLRNYVQESWAQIDVQLKRRNDLIPNLLATVKGYAKYEQSTLEKVTALRSQLMSMDTDADHQKAMAVSNELSNTLKSLFAVSEAYPDLKASTQYSNLMEELTNTENKIAYSRQLYNSSVNNLNIKIETFPSNLVAKLHHFMKQQYLQTPDEEKTVPKVSF